MLVNCKRINKTTTTTKQNKTQKKKRKKKTYKQTVTVNGLTEFDAGLLNPQECGGNFLKLQKKKIDIRRKKFLLNGWKCWYQTCNFVTLVISLWTWMVPRPLLWCVMCYPGHKDFVICSCDVCFSLCTYFTENLQHCSDVPRVSESFSGGLVWWFNLQIELLFSKLDFIGSG